MAIKVTAPVRWVAGGWPDSPPFRDEYGGCVLNAAINRRVSATLNDFDLTTSLNGLPKNCGLGTSATLRTCFLVASNPALLQGNSKKKIELAKRVWVFENESIGQRGGIQDQIAAIFGGVNLISLGRGNIREMKIKVTGIPKGKAQHLEQRLVLIYTGKAHLSHDMHSAVFGSENYNSNIPKFQDMSRLFQQMAERINHEKMMAEYFNEMWDLQKSLHNSIETPAMRKLQSALQGSYLAFGVPGAGGGGCCWFYVHDRQDFFKAWERTKEKFPGCCYFPFKFEYKGVRIEKD